MNPRIRGWCNYFSTVSSKKTYSRLRLLLFYRLWRWAKRRHPSRSAKWRYQKYFRKRGPQLTFGLETTEAWIGVKYHNRYKITRHVKVKGDKSPYDGDLPYWIKRMSRYSGWTGRTSRLLRKQKALCSFCCLPFWSDDVMETDHIIPRSKGGKAGINNLRLVHAHCHDQRNLFDKSSNSGSTVKA